MKRVLLFFSLMLIIGTSNVYSQMPVKDKGKWSVLNNMEFMDRVRLQPEWYHYWIWYKKVLGIKIPLPGLGLHDKYGKEDRRNFQLQEIPMMAAVEYNKSETEKEGYNVDTIYRQELFKFGDKEIDYQYTLTKNRRNDILNDINKKLVEYSSKYPENPLFGFPASQENLSNSNFISSNLKKLSEKIAFSNIIV